MLERFLLELLALGLVFTVYLIIRASGMRPSYRQFENIFIAIAVGAVILLAALS